jgi:3-hydroxyacyl-CoA dehydrogenase
MAEKKMRIDEIDAVIGKALGRPGSAIFGTLDLVGLDTGHHVMKNLYEAVPNDEMRDMFIPSDVMNTMMERKWLGNKTKQGFYKRAPGDKGWSSTIPPWSTCLQPDRSSIRFRRRKRWKMTSLK